MIQLLEEKYIKTIAEAHCLAWQKGFRKILSNRLLDNLQQVDFRKNWKVIIKRKDRTNYIFLRKNKAVGFVSFGPPHDKREDAQFEIYGIYVHPDFWKKKIGYQLLQHAVYDIFNQNINAEIILWVMSENWNSRSFYTRFGFKTTPYIRSSSRNNEHFKEIKYLHRLT